ncbi:hypothetical protein [Streptomyces sp. NPDC020747]|uniref:hypothetical protein n=1 Tax=Streptomyces sp. NPDC020747 TaxID=3365086 RepID=UPI00379D381F
MSLKAPYGWTKGAYPRGQLPEFVAGVLSDQLGRAIDVSQIWPQRFPDAEPGGVGDPGLGPPWSEEHVDRILFPLLEQENDVNGRAPWPGEPVSGAVLVSLAVDWLTADSTPAAGRSEGSELSAETVDVLVGWIARLRRLSASQSGVALVMDWAVHELRWARHLAQEAAYDAPTGRRLYAAIAELAQLAGWLAEDQGQYVQGQQFLLAALRASALAGDRNLGAGILACLSCHLTKCGNGRDAQRLRKLADAGMGDAVPGALRSLLASRETGVDARFGDELALVERDGATVGRAAAEQCAAAVGSLCEEEEEWLLGQPPSRAEVSVADAHGDLSRRGGALTVNGRRGEA